MLIDMAPDAAGATLQAGTPSIRAAALDRATVTRALHRRLAVEFERTAAAGCVLALVVRSARTLQREGCPPELLHDSTERLVRACLLARGLSALPTRGRER